MSEDCKTPVLGFAGYSGAGKTTLLVKILPLLKLQGLRIAIIKQTHHDFEIDKPGKDSYVLRQAGADTTMLVSSHRSAIITEYEASISRQLDDVLGELSHEFYDLILIEGFRHAAIAKIELHRTVTGKPLLFPEDEQVIAVASDTVLETGGLPLLNINVPEEVAGFINRWLDNAGVKHVKRCA